MAFAVMNVVTTPPDEAAGLLAQIEPVYRERLPRQPGFRSARLYRAEDQSQIVTIVEWESRDQFLAYRQSDQGRQDVAGVVAMHPKISFLEVVAVVT